MRHAWKWLWLLWMAGLATLFLDLIGRVPECTLQPIPAITPVRAIVALLLLSGLAWKAGRESYRRFRQLAGRMVSMNFQRDGKRPRPAGDALTAEVEECPDYYAGDIESMRARIRKLTELLAAVLDTLPPEAQQQVLDRAGYGWRPVK